MMLRTSLPAHVQVRHGRASTPTPIDETGTFSEASGALRDGPTRALATVHHGTRDSRHRLDAGGV